MGWAIKSSTAFISDINTFFRGGGAVGLHVFSCPFHSIFFSDAFKESHVTSLRCFATFDLEHNI